MANLALFDFDGTITTKDSFVAFIEHAASPARFILGTLLLSPMIVAYKLGLLKATRIREAIVRVGLKGRDAAEVRAVGTAFSRSFFKDLVRPEAQARLSWHKERGDVIVVVSASLDAYLTDWCAQRGFALICTELEAVSGRLTGRYQAGDCTGAEKARRVRARYDLAAYQTIYAYGDTQEDTELLALASETERFFRWDQRSKA